MTENNITTENIILKQLQLSLLYLARRGPVKNQTWIRKGV